MSLEVKEIIALSVFESLPLGDTIVLYRAADAILSALTAAGYRVVREGELDAAVTALEFYANPANYKEQLVTESCGCCSYWHDPKIGKDGEDTGAVAAAALRALVGEAK